MSILAGLHDKSQKSKYAALDQGYVDEEQFKMYNDLASEISRMISGLMKYVRNSISKGVIPQFWVAESSFGVH